jgi:hypothetical protein
MPVVAESSFAFFVYPFLFDPATFAPRVAIIERATLPIAAAVGACRERVWEIRDFPKGDLLPHVADYLNNVDAATAHLWELSDRLDSAFGLAECAEWVLIQERRGYSLPFRFGEVGSGGFSVQLCMFRTGVGFMTVQVRPRSSALSDWLDFLHYFRTADGQHGVYVQVRPRHSPDGVAPFLPAPAEGGDGPDTRGFQAVLHALLRTADLNEERHGVPWWRETFVRGRMMPYVGLYVDGMPDEETRARLLYRVRNFLRSTQEIRPSEEDLRLQEAGHLLPFGDGMWQVFSQEGGAFVACDAPRAIDSEDDSPANLAFFRRILPAQLREDYFLLFMLALQQQFVLRDLSEEVANYSLAANEVVRLEGFDRIRSRLLEFTARSYFAQVMQREHHHRTYVKWLQTLEIERLYSEVRDEAREIQEWIQSQQAEALKLLAEEERRQAEVRRREQEQAEQAARELAEELARRSEAQDKKRAENLAFLFHSIAVLIGLPALCFSYLSTHSPIPWALSAKVGIGAFAVALGTVALMKSRHNRQLKEIEASAAAPHTRSSHN